MASCQTSQWVSTSPYVKLTVTESSSSGSSVTLSWKLQYIASSAANTSANKSYTVKIAGSEVKSGSYNIDGKSGTNDIASGTKVINKTTAAQTISFSVSFGFNLTWSGSYSGTRSVSGSISVAAKTSYKVSYNANGGSGAPSAQTKWYGTTLKLSTTKPSRTGYAFNKWNTNSGGTGTSYSPGANYTANAAATLYAQWTANTYTVSYNANGGSGAPASQTKTYGTTLKLSSTKPTRTNYTFKGWATSASAITATYSAGGSYTANAAITLYAVWEPAYKKPKITNLSVVRCNSAGNASDSGTYAKVSFDWSTFHTVSNIVIKYTNGSSTITAGGFKPTGTSGSLSRILGNGNLSIESTYTFSVTVLDSGGSTTLSRPLAGSVFPADYLAGGKGVAFGKAAELENTADFAFETHHRDKMTFENNTCIHGTKPDGTVYEAFNPTNENGNTVIGWDNYDNLSGNTNVYGFDVNIGVSNIGAPATFRPYFRRGDTINVTIRTGGYVTSSMQDVSFLVPLTRPVIGSPTVTVSSASGFVLRQGEKYTHGSSATTYTVPNSYDATLYPHYGVAITAHFSNTTNATNNDATGIYWSGTITFT